MGSMRSSGRELRYSMAVLASERICGVLACKI